MYPPVTFRKVPPVGSRSDKKLASALATIDGYNDSGDDLNVSCRPDLMLLVSPVNLFAHSYHFSISSIVAMGIQQYLAALLTG